MVSNRLVITPFIGPGLVMLAALMNAAFSVNVAANVAANASPDTVQELREFKSADMRERYYQLIDQLRCPKCQNQNLADSDAPIAEDLRNELFMLLDEGYSNKDILDFMVSRYGEFVLYSPPVNTSTAVLWLLPALLLALGIALLVVIIVRNRQPGSAPESTAQLDAQTQARVDAIVARQSQTDSRSDS